MTTIHQATATLLNLVGAGLIFYAMLANGTDKAVLFMLVYFPLLIAANLLIWLVLRAQNSRAAGIYQRLGLLLLFAFVPLLLFTALV